MRKDKRNHDEKVNKFQKNIWNYYKKHRRRFPWRNTNNPYHILISEFMLQQTQVERVVSKYEEFVSVFPDIYCLSQSSLRKVLSIWKGLGYNRRALNLRLCAQKIVNDYSGDIPQSIDHLTQLPGIGKATASAIVAFAFNKPSVFIETNIRRVYIHFFFHDKEGIHDREILPIIEKTLKRRNPREWYYALMDYGSMLKKEFKNPNRKSLHYQKQSSFEGSRRQIRGVILKELLKEEQLSCSSLIKRLGKEPGKVKEILIQMQKEGIIQRIGLKYLIP
jgi:A/G-specific adenine glycosylase